MSPSRGTPGPDRQHARPPRRPGLDRFAPTKTPPRNAALVSPEPSNSGLPMRATAMPCRPVLEHGGCGLPTPRIDGRVPTQLVEQHAAIRVADLVADQPVAARRQSGAERAQRGGGGARAARRERSRPPRRGQEMARRAAASVSSRRPRPSTTTRQTAAPAGRSTAGWSGGDAERAQHARQHRAEPRRAVGRDIGTAFVGCRHRSGPVRRADRGGRRQRLGESQRVGQRALALGIGADPQRQVVAGQRAGVPVVGVTVRVAAGGRLEVDPGHRAPADGQGDLPAQRTGR